MIPVHWLAKQSPKKGEMSPSSAGGSTTLAIFENITPPLIGFDSFGARVPGQAVPWRGSVNGTDAWLVG